MSNMLDRLLQPENVNLQKNAPTIKVEVTRLSNGEDKAIFTLRAMTHKQFRAVMDRPAEDRDIHELVSCCVDPDFHDKRLICEEKGIMTPIDAVRAYLLPGEIAALVRKIDDLSGFRADSITEIKNV